MLCADPREGKDIEINAYTNLKIVDNYNRKWAGDKELSVFRV